MSVCVLLQRNTHTHRHRQSVKPIKIQPCHIASSSRPCCKYTVFTHRSRHVTCVQHAFKPPPPFFFSSISFFPSSRLTICFKSPTSGNWRRPRRECDQNRRNITLSIHLQHRGLMWSQEMSCERQAVELPVPAATSLQVEIK